VCNSASILHCTSVRYRTTRWSEVVLYSTVAACDKAATFNSPFPYHDPCSPNPAMPVSVRLNLPWRCNAGAVLFALALADAPLPGAFPRVPWPLVVNLLSGSMGGGLALPVGLRTLRHFDFGSQGPRVLHLNVKTSKIIPRKATDRSKRIFANGKLQVPRFPHVHVHVSQCQHQPNGPQGTDASIASSPNLDRCDSTQLSTP
jgi:hypothetical protein